MTIYEIIEEIAATASTNAKKAILEQNKDNEVLKQVFHYAYNPRYNYWIKPGPLSNIENSGSDINLATLDSLRALIDRKITGNDARTYFENVLKPLSSQAREILCRILNHDLRCGASDTLASKTWKNLVPEYPVMLCEKYNEKTEKYLKNFEGVVPFIIDLKADGGRLIATVDSEGNVTYRSRSGSPLNLFGVFDKELSKLKNMVFDGELIVETADGKPDRKTGNGYYTRAVRDTLTQEQANNFTYVVWDSIPIEEYNAGLGTEPVTVRKARVEAIGFQNNVKVIESYTVNTLAECQAIYTKMREDGQEGSIIKVSNSVYEDKRSKNYVKLKAENSADLLCVAVEEGQGKYAGMIGNLVCVTSCGNLEVRPGSGLKDDDRARAASYFIGNIIEIAYNEVITSKGKDKASLFLPIYKSVRMDKKVANTLDELA